MGNKGNFQPVAARLAVNTELTANGCLVWKSVVGKNYYASMSVEGKRVTVHRYLYEQKYGPVKEGLELDHLCRNKACVNIDHLEPVTHAENIFRARPSEWNAGKKKTHCHRGHPLSGENLIVGTRGRLCRECSKITRKMVRERKMEARKKGRLVVAEQATVFIGGGRRWLTVRAACRAEAKAIIKRHCECDKGDEFTPSDHCRRHADQDKYSALVKKLAERIYKSTLRAEDKAITNAEAIK